MNKNYNFKIICVTNCRLILFKKSMKLFVLIFSILLTSSCAIHTSKTAPQILQAPKGSKYVDIAVGYSRSTYLWDIGGLGKSALINDAKRSLFSFPLEPGQTFDNVTLDTKTTFIGPFTRRHVVLIADVVQKDSAIAFDFSDYYRELTGSKQKKTKDYLFVNEKIICYHNRQTYFGRVLDLDDERPLVYFIDNFGTLKIRKKSLNSLFKINDLEEIQKFVKFTLGDKVKAEIWNGEGKEIKSGTIIGLNLNYALIKTNNSTYPALIEGLEK